MRLVVERKRHAVDVREVMHAQAVLCGNVTKVGELLLASLGQRLRRAADEKVGRQAGRRRGPRVVAPLPAAARLGAALLCFASPKGVCGLAAHSFRGS